MIALLRFARTVTRAIERGASRMRGRIERDLYRRERRVIFTAPGAFEPNTPMPEGKPS